MTVQRASASRLVDTAVVPHGPAPTTVLLTALWPSFIMAGVLEALIFVVVDPDSLRWFGHDRVSLSTMGVYTVTYLIVWSVVFVACAMTALLLRFRPSVEAPPVGPARPMGLIDGRVPEGGDDWSPDERDPPGR